MPQRINIVGDLGTTKLASDSYDIDNIYLSEEGWVYRHFKSTDGSRYWDEIIVAGEVPAGDSPQATNPPKLGTVAAPASETGDGVFDIQYSSHQVTGSPGDYTNEIITEGGGLGVGSGQTPAAGDIGDIAFTGPNPFATVLKGVAHTYSASVSDPTGVTFTWTTSDGDGVLSSTTGDTVDITWTSGGNKTVTVTANKAGATDDGKKYVYNESVTEYTMGTVSVVVDPSFELDFGERVPITVPGGSWATTRLKIEQDGRNVNDMTYAWSCTSANAANLEFSYGQTDKEYVNVSATAAGTYTIQCVVSSAKAGGVSGDGLSPATHTITLEGFEVITIRPISISGNTTASVDSQVTATANSGGNIDESDLTYYWIMYSTTNPNYQWDSDRDEKTVKFTPKGAGSFTLRCNVGTTVTTDTEPDFDGTILVASPSHNVTVS